jgi:ubiquinone/menaquinone biosynthesis C-methylase UbiE
VGGAFEFEEVFDEDYLYFYGPSLSELAGPATDLIWSLLALEEGAEVLDLACGHGRITNALARRGARASGLDASRLFLDRAQADAAQAGLNTHYEQGDMRCLPWGDGSFDYVISWFTSFGYFADAENRRVLSESHRVLRPGGKLLIENNNPAELLPR